MNDLFWFLIRTGCRSGEGAVIKTEDINLEGGADLKGFVHIKTSLTKDEDDNVIIGEDTKTGNDRYIPLNEPLKDILIPRMKEPEDLIFTQPNGNLITGTIINTHFKKICKNAGIRVTTYQKKKSNGKYVNVKTSTATVHCLRHFAATVALAEGAKIKGVQNLLGHSEVDITLNTYADGTEELKEDAIDKINDYIISCLDNTDTETILQNIRETDLYSLEEQEIIDMKQQLIRTLNIQGLENKIKQAILNLSRVEQYTSTTKSLSNKLRLDLIYNLINNFEILKTQTRDLKRNKSDYNKNNEYILNYLLTAQELFIIIHKYSEYQEPKKQPKQKHSKQNNLKLLTVNQ